MRKTKGFIFDVPVINICGDARMGSIPKFTVVVAGYQAEPYLQKALDSIASQTYQDFEAICYVEESTDRSLEICEAMSARDSRFQVASGPKSGGVAATRNYGIDNAKGEYLVFLDGDDWLVSDMLEKLSEKLGRTGNVDVLSFAAVSTENEKFDWERAVRITNFRASDEEEVFTGQEAIRRAGCNGGSIHSYTWLSIYRVDFLRKHRLYQTPGLLMEDLESTPRIWFSAQKMAFLNEVLYVYRRRANSLTTMASPKLVLDISRQFQNFLMFIAEHAIAHDILLIWGNQWISVLYWFMFHPISSRKITDDDRRQALAVLLSGEGKSGFCRMAWRATLPKRLALPFVLLAAKGFQFPAKFFFRKIYYPLVEMRGR